MKFINNTTCFINFVNRTCGQEEFEDTKGVIRIRIIIITIIIWLFQLTPPPRDRVTNKTNIDSMYIYQYNPRRRDNTIGKRKSTNMSLISAEVYEVLFTKSAEFWVKTNYLLCSTVSQQL